MDWLSTSISYSPKVKRTISKWVVECIGRNYIKKYYSSLENLIDTSIFTYELSKIFSPAFFEGIPESIINQFPGLDTGLTVFMPGEQEKAISWLLDWLRKNSKDYLKIIDPYFGINEIYLLNKLDVKIKVIVITMDEALYSDNEENSRKKIIDYWSKNCSSKIPNLNFFIAPKKSINAFHDRVIITNGSGLDIGTSLNSFGKKAFNIKELNYDETKKLENEYADPLMNVSHWILEHGEPLKSIQIG